jgi:hypothetical protein
MIPDAAGAGREEVAPSTRLRFHMVVIEKKVSKGKETYSELLE